MKSIAKFSLITACIFVSGCNTYPGIDRMSYVSLADGIKNPSDPAIEKAGYSRVFTWNSDYSAGIGNSKGMCVQGALTATASSFGAAMEVAAEKLEADANSAVQFSQNVIALNASSVQTSFANTGYFYACQIALNNMSSSGEKLSNDQIVDLFKHVGDTAKNIKIPSTNLSTLDASEIKLLEDYRAKKKQGEKEENQSGVTAGTETDTEGT